MSVALRTVLLLSGTLAGSAFIMSEAAFADDAQTQQLQNQINALQKQLQTLQDQMTAAKSVPAGLYDQAPPHATLPTKALPSWLSGVKVSFAGSFIAAETAWRQHNEISSGASDPPFSTLPFSDSPLGHESEWRASAQQSRISIRMSGDIDPTQHLTAYYESDFLGAGVTANSRESNSYNLRIRQAWMFYDNEAAHFNILAGQGWSLVTQDRTGILPLMENAPLTIDAQYVAGFNWARQEQLRFVADYNKQVWFGVSVEAPQVNFPSNSIGTVGAPGTQVGASPSSAVPPGLAINSLNVCNASGLLDSTTACSNDVAPDFVEKIALDPGWGHYELLGLERFFGDEVGSVAVPNSWSQKVNFGWGIGGSFLIPAIPKILDLQGSVLTGQGTGRYGSSQLPDVYIGPDGTLKPLQTLQVLLGAVAHPFDSLDIYAYAGEEEVKANFWTIGGVQGGFGNPNYVNNGCLTEDMVSGPASFIMAPAGTTCTANIKSVQELTVGFWKGIYKGDLGRITFGMQYEYVRLQAFPGLATGTGTPNQGLNPNNNIFFTSIRYYPF